MIGILCAALSALGFYFSMGLGDQWWLAWLAPMPVLWFAFGQTKDWQAFLVAWLAYALGGTSILRAYGGLMPVPVLILSLAGPALSFAFPVLAAKRVQQSFGAVAAMFTFAAFWAGLDFVSSFNRGGGAVASPSSAEIGAPFLIQSASLVGFFGVTFLLGAVAAGIAASVATHRRLPAVIAVTLLAANAVFGYARISQPPGGTLHVALIESDDTVGRFHTDNEDATFKAIDAYAAEIEKLRGRQVALIVLPENISRVAPQWRGAAQAKLAMAANDVGATLVAGFNTYLDGAQRNVSWAFTPNAPAPTTYMKRRLVPGLETDFYTPGPGPRVLPNGIGLEICKDMDFHAMLRADEVATHPALLAVPAWDFDTDDWSHGRVAIMRSVENGVPMARTARDGLLTLDDRYGRIVSRARSVGPFTTLIGDLPLDGRGGYTIYDRIGDLFGWLCLVLGFAATGLALARSHIGER
jgi:apolipoprotein N-acyltransferase